jgi:predicted metal-binding protein
MSEWVTRALELGADAAQLIPTDQVVVADWVRLKCQYGCGAYGSRLTCPPHSPPPEVTRQVLRHYRQGLLLRMEGAGGGWKAETRQRLQMSEVVAALERELFLAGHYRAWGMGAGPCRLCEECDLSAPCRFPSQARPSMEACGIDVYTTVRQAGWEIEVVQTQEAPFRLFGLVLME